MAIIINKLRKKLFTLLAYTVYLQPMPHRNKIIDLSKPVLEFLNFWVPHLDECAAFQTDQVVMMLMPYFLLIPGLLAADLNLFRHAGLAKEIQISLDSGKSDLRVVPGDGFMQLPGSNVTACRKEHIENRLPLFCLPQALIPDMGYQRLFCLCRRHLINDSRYQQ